jgi:UDP-glucose 4-epimerase
LKPALSPYGNTKKICEEILRDTVIALDDMKGIALRYFNPIGAHSSGLIGEMPQGVPNNLMPYLTQVAAGVRPELLIYGDDYNTPDGTAVRDYIHVEDLADAHVKAVDRLLSNDTETDLEIFNLGTGNGYSVKQVIAAFEKSTGVKVPHRVVARREGDAPEVYSATAKANNTLGWKATRSIEEMTASAWQWESNYRKSNIK